MQKYTKIDLLCYQKAKLIEILSQFGLEEETVKQLSPKISGGRDFTKNSLIDLILKLQNSTYDPAWDIEHFPFWAFDYEFHTSNNPINHLKEKLEKLKKDNKDIEDPQPNDLIDSCLRALEPYEGDKDPYQLGQAFAKIHNIYNKYYEGLAKVTSANDRGYLDFRIRSFTQALIIDPDFEIPLDLLIEEVRIVAKDDESAHELAQSLVIKARSYARQYRTENPEMIALQDKYADAETDEDKKRIINEIAENIYELTGNEEQLALFKDDDMVRIQTEKDWENQDKKN